MHEFEEYIKQSDPDKRKKAQYWRIAIGLQDVDGLKTSDYLRELARMHIEGEIDMPTAARRLEQYYEQRSERRSGEARAQSAISSPQSAISGSQSAIQSAKNCTLDEIRVIECMRANPSITQKALSEAIGKSERTIKTITTHLQQMGIVVRENGRRHGRWIIQETP